MNNNIHKTNNNDNTNGKVSKPNSNYLDVNNNDHYQWFI